jgi:hypothetical protein
MHTPYDYIDLLVKLVLAVGVVYNAYLAGRNKTAIAETKSAVIEVHTQINSRMSELLETVKSDEYQKGQTAGVATAVAAGVAAGLTTGTETKATEPVIVRGVQ